MAPKGGGGETCCIHRNEEKRVCSKRFPRQGRLSQVHFITAKLSGKQAEMDPLHPRSTVSQASGGKRLPKWAKGGRRRDLNEVFTLFFSLGAISYSEWPFSAITPVHPSVVLFSLQMLPEPKMATTQTRFPATTVSLTTYNTRLRMMQITLNVITPLLCPKCPPQRPQASLH